MTTTFNLYNKDMNFIKTPTSITTPLSFDSMESARFYMEREDVEGIVLTFEDGIMMKMKTEHYCRIHKILDNFVPKNIVANIVEGSFDDVIGILSDNGLVAETAMAEAVRTRFWKEIMRRKKEAEDYFNANKDKERKEVARELIPDRKTLASLVFKLFDGQDLEPYLMKNLAREAKEWTFD